MNTPSDAQLVDRFVTHRDEEAFRTLLERYSSLVYGTCQRVLRNTHDAEDAFQATFVVLARHMKSLHNPGALVAWLHRTAFRLALASARKASRFVNEPVEELPDQTPAVSEDEDRHWDEIRPVLDEELGRLPEKLRLPLLLCYLQQKTYQEAALALGITHTRLKGRLDQGRDLLKGRLLRRGVTLTAGSMLATLLSEKTAVAVPPVLIHATARAVLTPSIQAAVATGALSRAAVRVVEEASRALALRRAVWGIAICIMILAAGLATLLIPLGSLSPQTQKSTRSPGQGRAVRHSDSRATGNQPSAQSADLPLDAPASVREYTNRLKQALAMEDRARRWEAFRRLGNRLPDEDFAEIEAVLGSKAGKASPFHAELIHHWVASEPVMAATVIARLSASPRDNLPGVYPVRRTGSIRVDRGGVLQSSNKEVVLQNILSQWWEKDPSAAMAWARQMQPGQQRDLALGRLALDASLSSFEQAGVLLASVRDRSALASGGKQMAEEWAARDPQAAFAWVRRWESLTSLSEEWVMEMAEATMQTWLRKSFANALAVFQEMPPGSMRNAVAGKTVETWAGHDRDAALQWVEAHHPAGDPVKGALLRAIARTWVRNDPAALRQWALPHAGDPDWLPAIMETVAQWALKEPDGVIAWAKSLPEGRVRTEVYNQVVLAQFEREAPRRSMKDAAALADTLPSEYRREALLWMMEHSRRPHDLVQWLKKQPPGASRDDLILHAAYSNTSMYREEFYREKHAADFDGLLRLVEEMPDEEKSMAATRHVLEQWLRMDPKASTAWILRSSLSEPVKDDLLAQN